MRTDHCTCSDHYQSKSSSRRRVFIVAMPSVSSVRESARFIASHAQHVHINKPAITKTAQNLLPQMLPKNGESLANEVIKADPLEPPGLSNDELLEWLFIVDVLNFCFWSDEPTLFTVRHLGKDWTGYRSMCAALARAKARGIPVHKPEFYGAVTEEQMKEIFKSDTHVQIPLLKRRRSNLHEAAKVLNQKFQGKVSELIHQSNKSAQTLVQLLSNNFSSFRDTATYDEEPVAFLKRAQIFAADIWSRFGGHGYGEFHDIDSLTMFADYRVPQTLLFLDILVYDPPLLEKLKGGIHLESGSHEEVEIRGCSIWAVEILKETMLDLIRTGAYPQSSTSAGAPSVVNSVTLDFYLWNFAKLNSSQMNHFPIHRTLTHFY